MIFHITGNILNSYLASHYRDLFVEGLSIETFVCLEKHNYDVNTTCSCEIKNVCF